jgi:uncharacterized protein (TIGR04255 family)
MTMELPKQITPCPIKEAVVEIRFESNLPPDATFGVVFNALKERYKTADQLPILQIPEIVRSRDPELIYQPFYRLKSEDSLIQVGPRVLSLAVLEPYPGWSFFLPEILRVFNTVNELSFITQVSRLGLRYIDFFDEDIFGNINLHLEIYGSNAVTGETFVRTKLLKDGLNCNLQVGNNTVLNLGTGKAKQGSVIDVDTFTQFNGPSFFDEVEQILEDAHSIQKELFFDLLKPEFLMSLNPVY